MNLPGQPSSPAHPSSSQVQKPSANELTSPAPEFPSPAPIQQQPPAYGAPAPGYGAPAPGYGAPAPGHSAPGYGAPGYGEQGYGAPGYGAPPAPNTVPVMQVRPSPTLQQPHLLPRPLQGALLDSSTSPWSTSCWSNRRFRQTHLVWPHVIDCSPG